MAKRFLLIRLSALGDVVNTLPVVSALHQAYDDVEIDWLVEDRFADLLAQVHGISNVLVFPRKRLRLPTPPALLKLVSHVVDLRRRRYDVAIDFQGNLKGAMQLAAARSARRIGPSPAKERAHRLYGERVRVAKDLHRASRALALLEAAGVEVPYEPAMPQLDRSLLPTFRRDRGVAALVRERLLPRDSAKPLILLHPGTSAFGAFKRWPPGRFAEAVLEIERRFAVDVRITHGPGEEDLAQAVVSAGRERGAIRVVAPVGGLIGLLELLRCAQVFVAADCGPLHLAAALDVPCVGLFGPKDPGMYAPPWEHARVVRAPPPCAPCSLRRCDDPICMSELPVAAVVDAVGATIQGLALPPVLR